MSVSKAAGLFALATLLISNPHEASASAYEFDTAAISTDDSSTYTLGIRFTTNSDLLITQFGYFDNLGDGLNQAHDVGIFNSAGSLLASATVPQGVGGVLIGHYRYVSLTTPFALTANTLYVLAGVTSGLADPYAYGNGTDGSLVGFSTDPSISIANDAARYVQQNVNTLQFPTDVYKPYTIYGGPNFESVAVPEPATLILTASTLGIVGLGRIRRRTT